VIQDTASAVGYGRRAFEWLAYSYAEANVAFYKLSYSKPAGYLQEQT